MSEISRKNLNARIRNRILKSVILIAALAGLASTSAFAVGTSGFDKSVAFADGQTAPIFADGKMGMEGRYAQTIFMEESVSMKTTDGRTLTMVGNETARVGALLQITP